MFVAAGTCIEVIAYAVTTEPFNIIYYGNRNYYEAIIEQEKHFITYDSKEFRGSHTHNSQGSNTKLYICMGILFWHVVQTY